MNQPASPAAPEIPGVRVKIVGVGGAGTNAVDRLKLNCLAHVHLAVVNTDQKSLSSSPVEEKVMLGRATTRGLSAGGDVELGRKVAEDDRALLERLASGVDLLFLLSGLGGGTGTGASPVLAEVAAAQGAVVIAFVTLPFNREGARRREQAEEGLARLRQHCHAVITLPNDLLLQQVDEDATVIQAFELADSWIEHGVRAVWSMLFQNGLINVDFATLRNAFAHHGGKTLFGIGKGRGENFVDDALRDLEHCPLLHLPDNKYVKQADSLIVHLSGGPDLSMAVVNQVIEHVADKFGSRENLVLGAVIDGGLRQSLSLTVIGTTDIRGTSRRATPRRAAAPARLPAAEAAPIDRPPTPAPGPAPEVALATPEAVATPPDFQGEFGFPTPEEDRGFFDHTDPNTFEGEDLDLPTYFRRGIKITLDAR